MPRASTEKLRVLQIVPLLTVGGLERVAATLAVELAPRIDKIVVAGKPGHLAKELSAAGVHVEAITPPTPPPRATVVAARELAGILRRERPNVVHAHNPGAAAAAALARALARAPEIAIVTTYHGVEDDRVATAARTMRLASDLVVGVGTAATRELIAAGLPRNRSATIYNAVSVRPQRSVEEVRREFAAEGSELVVTVGRVVEQKNHALLIDALALLRARRPRLRALLVGAGPLEADVRAQVARLGLDDTVTVTGLRRDAVDLIAAADVFVLSSHWEALPIVVLEAMALERPVVTTAVRGVVDAVRDGRSGVTVPPGDAAALAAAMERLLDDPELRRRLARGARSFADRYCTLDGLVDRYLEAYGDALARRPRG